MQMLLENNEALKKQNETLKGILRKVESFTVCM